MARGCVVAGWGRWVKAGGVGCEGHGQSEGGRESGREGRELAVELGRCGAAVAAAKAVGRRVRRGDFAGLLGEAEERVAREGALGRAFGDELAALWVALWRLVGDPELGVLDQARA